MRGAAGCAVKAGPTRCNACGIYVTSYGMERPVDEYGNLDKVAAKRVVSPQSLPPTLPFSPFKSLKLVACLTMTCLISSVVSLICVCVWALRMLARPWMEGSWCWCNKRSSPAEEIGGPEE